MPVYQLQPEGFLIMRKQIITRLSVLALAVLVFLLLQEYWASNRGSASSGATAALGILVLVGFGLAGYRAIKQQQAAWESFRLYTGEEYIVRTQKNLPPIQIKKADIREIIRAADGSLLIKGPNQRDFIAIPAHVSSYQELLTDLSSYSAIKPQPEVAFYLRYPMVLTLGIVGLMGLFFFSQQPYVIVGTGLVLLGLLSWSFVEIQRSKHYDKKFKTKALLALLPLLAILARVYVTLKELLF